ncbi:M48 family metallopeptidase [Roseibium sp. RKSG952]|uniref:M48 family metallopeptidase n=1 Tax=Roseibium sp. RKSG952 TaxID=2529384 RepID=UPI0018AD1632|nr:M48 family metallopeptidase [Roseibium sp. RKSG952]
MKSIARLLFIELLRMLSIAVSALSSVAMAFVLVPITHYAAMLVGLEGIKSDAESYVWVAVVAFSPVWLAFVLPYWAERFLDVENGGRAPSTRETELIDRVHAHLVKAAEKREVKLPKVVYRVIDTGQINACAYGRNRVAFTRGLLHRHGTDGIEHLAAIAAHEMGHLRNWDTRFMMANRFLGLPVNLAISILNNTVNRIPFIGLFGFLLLIAFRLPADIGQFLLRLSSQSTEYQADAFARKVLGSEGMAAALDELGHSDEWHGGSVTDTVTRSHPSSELRRDRVLHG